MLGGDILKVNILGTEYTVVMAERHEDPTLDRCDGYCDKTSKKIVVANKDPKCDLDDFEAYQRQCLRHEIIHAFLFESGLHGNFSHETGHDETYVDWIAVQYPKMKKAFVETGCDEQRRGIWTTLHWLNE